MTATQLGMIFILIDMNIYFFLGSLLICLNEFNLILSEMLISEIVL